jgi:hypothetical protein
MELFLLLPSKIFVRLFANRIRNRLSCIQSHLTFPSSLKNPCERRQDNLLRPDGGAPARGTLDARRQSVLKMHAHDHD